MKEDDLNDNHTCNCGKPGTLQKDPYMEEIYNETIYKYICEECYHEACMDI